MYVQLLNILWGSMKVYIACGLTHVPRGDFDEYVDFLHKLASDIRQYSGAEVKYALQDSDPQLSRVPLQERAKKCYAWDREMVEWADIIVAEASYPSTGLGIELQIAENKNIPIIAIFQLLSSHKAPEVKYWSTDNNIHNLQLGDGYISLMALGLPSILKVIPYKKNETIYPQIISLLK